MLKYNDNIYGITVFLTRDLKEFKSKSKASDMPEDCDGFTYDRDGKYYIWIQDYLKCPDDIIVLSHELIHVVSDVFEYTGVVDMHEAYAYYHSALLRHFVERMRK